MGFYVSISSSGLIMPMQRAGGLSDILAALTDDCNQETFRADGAGNFGGYTVVMDWDWWYHLCHILWFWVNVSATDWSGVLLWSRVTWLIQIIFPATTPLLPGYHATG